MGQVKTSHKMGYFANMQVLVKRGDLSDKLKHPVKWGDLPMFKCWLNGAICGTFENISEIGLFYQHLNVGENE